MSVHDELVAVGGTRIGASFNQGSFTPFNAVEGADVSGGYCAGVVLDWARRVLQSAPDRDESYLSYSAAGYAEPRAEGDVQSKQSATVRRMARAYAGQAQNYVAETDKTAATAALRQLLNGIEVSYSSYGTGVPVSSADAKLFGKLWNTSSGSFQRFNLSMEPAGTLSHAAIRRLLENLEGREDSQHQTRAAGGRHWESFAAELDERFRQIRVGDGRQVPPRKLFGNLRVVRTRPSTSYASGGAWMGVLLHEGFLENGCTVLSFSPTAGGSGHAVAVHQTGGDEFRFFDPNYGVYRFSRTGLQHCFQHLFWARIAVGTVGAVDREKAVYLRRDRTTDPPIGSWNKMAYTIFQRE